MHKALLNFGQRFYGQVEDYKQYLLGQGFPGNFSGIVTAGLYTDGMLEPGVGKTKKVELNPELSLDFPLQD